MSKQILPADCHSAIAQTFKKLTDEEVDALVRAATEARRRAYCPYSKFAVGAALLTEDGTTVVGCNVENISYGLTICAERSAACTAVTQGHRTFIAIAIVAEQSDRFVGPCGACRQFLGEFGMQSEVYLARPSGHYMKTTMTALMPDSFTPDWVKLNN